MSDYHGDIRLGDTIDIKFETTVNGTPTNLAGATVVAYPGNSTTEVTGGITLSGSPFDTAQIGYNNIRVVATGGNGYATATDYALAFSAGTLGGISLIGRAIGTFSIENRSALMPTTAARTLDVSATGEGGLDFDNIKDATGAHTLTNIRVPNVTLTDTVTTVTGLTAADVGAIKAKTDNLPSDPADESIIIAATDAIITAIAALQADLPTKITKNVALASFPFFMVKASDHVSGQTGLTVTATRSLDGAAFAPCANAVSAIGNGWYKISLDATDTNANTIAFNFDGGVTADVLAFTVVTQPT